MAIPFYENEEQLQQQHKASEEIDQVDGPTTHTSNSTQYQNPASAQWEGLPLNQTSANQQDLMAWKVLALAMCKALKDHCQQNMANSNSTTTAGTSIPSTQSNAAVIQILPNGQVKPQWN